MKAVYYFFGFALLTLGSCSSGLYVGTEYDDLYYQDSDQPVTRVVPAGYQSVAEGDLRSGGYYNNIYASDTLVSDEYASAIDSSMNNQIINNYYGTDSYTGRLRTFYGNYFNPYWRDPFYYSGFPSIGLGFSFGYPYYYSGFPYYNSYFYDPFYYDMFYSPYSYGFGGFYGGYYGGYYGGLFGRPWYPYYGYGYGGYGYGYGYGYGGYGSDYNFGGVKYGRRERPSNLTARRADAGPGSGTYSPTATSSRRTSNMTTTSGTAYSGRTGSQTQAISGQRRSTTGTVNPGYSSVASGRRQIQDPVSKSGSATSKSAITSRPQYNSANRSYTPSYSNPRMSTRPSYNNTRVNSGVREYNNAGTYNGSSIRSNQNNAARSRSNSSFNPGAVRSAPSFSAPRSYSAPSRRSYSGNSYSSGSFNSGSRSSSSPSFNSGSVSRGSSSSSSSYSSGSSSRSSSSGGGGSSSGRRR